MENPRSNHVRVRATSGGEVLTGRYPCLTLQLNVTAHQQQQTGKLVLTVREPNEHERFVAIDVPLGDWAELRELAPRALARALSELERILWGRWPVNPID